MHHRLRSLVFLRIFQYQALWFVVVISRVTVDFSNNDGRTLRWLRVWIRRVNRSDWQLFVQLWESNACKFS